ncbi:hypothetical protein Golob_013649, partial [Gossypium lobatum]|nr:hypothetical protein [Gossypium lobatum]
MINVGETLLRRDAPQSNQYSWVAKEQMLPFVRRMMGKSIKDV